MSRPVKLSALLLFAANTNVPAEPAAMRLKSAWSAAYPAMIFVPAGDVIFTPAPGSLLKRYPSAAGMVEAPKLCGPVKPSTPALNAVTGRDERLYAKVSVPFPFFVSPAPFVSGAVKVTLPVPVIVSAFPAASTPPDSVTEAPRFAPMVAALPRVICPPYVCAPVALSKAPEPSV